MNKKFINDLRLAFKQRLSRKTGWGRVELEAEFELAISEVLSSMLDEIEVHNSDKSLMGK